MIKTHMSEMEAILREYLSHITYIDDDFKIAWEEEDQEDVKRPGRSGAYVQKEANEENTEEITKQDSLWNFCLFMQKRYPDISLIPVPYFQGITEKALKNYIDSAKLLVIDWELESGAAKTAIDIIKESNFKNLFKLCVIYTSNLSQAQEDFYKNMGYKEEQIKTGGEGNKTYIYVRDHANLFMLCEKRQFNFDDIIREFTGLFLKEIGYFSISFIEMFSRLEKQIPRYLNDFKEPFDSLLLLQAISDRMPFVDLNYELDNMIMSTLRDDIHLNGNVLEKICDQKMKDIQSLLDQGNYEDLNGRILGGIDRICDSIKGCAKAKNILKKIQFSEYKQILLTAISDKEQPYISIQEAAVKLTDRYLDIEFEDGIAQAGEWNPAQKEALRKEYKKLKSKEIKKKMTDAIPVFLIMILEPEKEWNQTLRKLIFMLKICKYTESEIELKDIFRDCHTPDKDGNMELKRIGKKNRNWKLTYNKVKQGDVFFRYAKDRSTQVEECYLCVMPKCHMLRPDKIDGKLQLIKGMVKDAKSGRVLRENEHLTLLPNPRMENQTLFVTWQFYNVFSMDLEYLDSETYDGLYREYRLDDDYVRQIMGEFNAFYAKVGVEEIFAKNNIIFPGILAREGMSPNV